MTSREDYLLEQAAAYRARIKELLDQVSYDSTLLQQALNALLAPRDADWQPKHTSAVKALRERLGILA